MLYEFLKMVAYLLAFWFVYRVVVGALRYLAGDSSSKEQVRKEPPRGQKQSEPPVYRDIKDAHFKDLPDEPGKPS